MAVLYPGEGDERRRSLGNGTHVGGSRAGTTGNRS